jgi:GGDEF domain-containing protein
MGEALHEDDIERGSGEADPGGGTHPPIEPLLAAFREVARRRGHLAARSGPDAPDPEESGPPIQARPEPNGETAFPELEVPRSPAEVLEATIAAFRTARGRAKAHRTEESPAERTGAERPDEEPSSKEEPSSEEEAPTEQEEPEQGGGEQEESEGDSPFSGDGLPSSEELAPAFRRALSERSCPSENAEPAHHPEEERPERGGYGDDGPPPSSLSGASPSGPVPSNSEAPPTGPGDSFLWVTAQPGERSPAVSVDRLSEPRAAEAEAFLLREGGERPYRLLRRIRGHPDASVYLKPVFWEHEEGKRSPVSMHVDGEWTGEERLDALREKAAEINRRIETVVEAGEIGDEGVELRVLRFMATRNHQFTPQRTAENSDGFVYPKLTPLLERESLGGGKELSRVLSMLDERRLLTGEFVMRQHTCRNCGCGFLNFEEMCPHCGSAELDVDDLVHHFRCAFTGALHEYKREEGRLVCPKCDRRLKQIGVDYDKPSVVHTCQRCHEEFQNPEVQTTCYRCGHTSPPEQQVKRQIKKYEITALGEETAIYGLSDSLLSILERESRVLDYATFQLIIESEAARIERYQRSTSSLLLVRVTDLKQVRMELGERSQEVIEEIATAFDNTLRSSDYLSARDESLYLFLLTETDQEGARRAGERLGENIEGVLNQNLAQPPGLDVAVQPLRPGIELDSLAEQFLSARP